jgi:hydroxylaminobenzene mutase
MPSPLVSTAPTDTRTLGRRLVWHGVLLFLLGLLVGLVVPAFANPRMGLSAHVGTVLNGALLVALGAAWSAIELSPRAQRGAFSLLVWGSYGGCLGLVLAAIFNTRASTPINGAAQPAGTWIEALVFLTLAVPGAAVLVGTFMALRGFGTKGRSW